MRDGCREGKLVIAGWRGIEAVGGKGGKSVDVERGAGDEAAGSC